MEEELIQKVATLINELALQQQNNQQLALDLSKQITEIKVLSLYLNRVLEYKE